MDQRKRSELLPYYVCVYVAKKLAVDERATVLNSGGVEGFEGREGLSMKITASGQITPNSGDVYPKFEGLSNEGVRGKLSSRHRHAGRVMSELCLPVL